MLPNEEDRIRREASHDRGFVQGEISENKRQSEVQRAREDNNAAGGLAVGIILASVVGLVLAAVYFLNRRDQIAPVIIPVTPISQPSATPMPTVTPNINITVPNSPQTVQPVPRNNINITVPSSPPQTVPRSNINITVPPQREPVTKPAPTPQSSSTPQASPIPQSSPTTSPTSSPN